MNGNDPFTDAASLLIGISYKGTPFGELLGELPRAPEDAKLMALVFKTIWPQDQHQHLIVELLDGEATSGQVWTKVEELRELSQGSLVNIYIAGHAMRDEFFPTQEEHFLTHDSELHDGRISNGISLNKLTEKLAELTMRRHHKIVLYADVCHAGHIDFTNWPNSQRAPMAVLCACAPDGEAYEDEHIGHFTESLVEALCGLGHVDNDRYVTQHHVAQYVTDRVLKQEAARIPQLINKGSGANIKIGHTIVDPDNLRDPLPSGVRRLVRAAFLASSLR